MHHPIQMKPADSEKSNGEWTHTPTQASVLHTHASIAFLNLLGNSYLTHVLAGCRQDEGLQSMKETKRKRGMLICNIYI